MQSTDHQQPRRALVTGAGGFIGRHLVVQLRQAGWNVATMGVAEGGEGHHHLASLTASGIQAVVEAVAPDWVFHLAGAVSGSLETMYHINTCYGVHLLQAAAGCAGVHVLLVGSAAEYGPQHANALTRQGRAVDESSPCRPVSPYGISKYAQSLHGLAVSESQPVIVARPFNVLGKGMPEHLALGRFVRQSLQLPATDRRIHTGPLHGVRDFIHVRDCVETMIALTKQPQALGKVVNLCSGVGVLLAQLVAFLVEQLSPPAIIQEATSSHPISDHFVGTGAELRRLGLSIPPCDLHACIKEMLS